MGSLTVPLRRGAGRFVGSLGKVLPCGGKLDGQDRYVDIGIAGGKCVV